MTEPLQVGQFAIVDHEPVDRGPNAGVFHGKGPLDDRAELYLLAEGTTPAGEAFAGHAISAAGQSWQTLDMSLTGALRQLFADTNQSLRDWNRKSIAQHRVTIGLAAFARRGTQAVIAQAGPSIVFHRSRGTVASYVADEEHGQPLGFEGEAEPQLTRIAFEPGDRVLLISTGALSELDTELVEGILGLPLAEVLSNLYRRLEHLRHVTVLFMSSEEPPAGEAPATPRISSAQADGDTVIGGPEEEDAQESFQPSLFLASQAEDVLGAARRQLEEVNVRIRDTAALPAVITDMPAPLQKAGGSDTLAQLAAERRSHASALTAAGHTRRPHAAPEHTAHDGSVEPQRRHRRGDSFTRGLVREETLPAPVATAMDAPLVGDMAEVVRARATLGRPANGVAATENLSVMASGGGSLVRVRGGMPGRWKGGGGLSRHHSATMEKLPPTWLIVLGGLGLLLLVVGMFVVPRLLSGNGGTEYADLIDGAQSRLATARAVQDPGEKRKALSEAEAFVLEARDAQGAGPEAEQLAKEIAKDVSALDNVKTPAAVQDIGSLEQFGDRPVAATRLVVSETNAFVLDNASGQVISMPLAGGDHKVVYREDKEAKHGRPIALAFAENGEMDEPSLLVLDNARNLWADSAKLGLRPVLLNLPQGAQASDIATWGGKLYVLDGPAGTVYRLAPFDGGFSGAIKVLETREMGNAQRLMVDEEIVIADDHGTLHRFAGQLSLTLSEAGIDKKLVSAETPFPMGGKNAELAVLDAPNNRIVVFRRDGTFDRQYRHKDFQGISALTMGNGGGYVFSGGKLRRVNFQ